MLDNMFYPTYCDAYKRVLVNNIEYLSRTIDPSPLFYISYHTYTKHDFHGLEYSAKRLSFGSRILEVEYILNYISRRCYFAIHLDVSFFFKLIKSLISSNQQECAQFIVDKFINMTIFLCDIKIPRDELLKRLFADINKELAPWSTI